VIVVVQMQMLCMSDTGGIWVMHPGVDSGW
jgi:hypothetical protein